MELPDEDTVDEDAGDDADDEIASAEDELAEDAVMPPVPVAAVVCACRREPPAAMATAAHTIPMDFRRITC